LTRKLQGRGGQIFERVHILSSQGQMRRGRRRGRERPFCTAEFTKRIRRLGSKDQSRGSSRGGKREKTVNDMKRKFLENLRGMLVNVLMGRNPPKGWTEIVGM